MKICFAMNYHYSERVGGAEVQAWLFAKELAKQGHQISYIAESLTVKQGTTSLIDNVNVYWIPHRLHFDVLNTIRYYAILKKINPEIIVQRYTSLYTGVIGHYSKVTGTKFMWVCTDNHVPYRDHFLKNQKETLREVSRPIHKRAVLILNASLRDAFRNYGMKCVTYPCVQNSTQYSLLLKDYGLKGISFPSGHEVPLAPPKKAFPPVILWVANMGRGKRPELFIQLSSLCQDLNVKFTMVGNHPEKKYVDSLLKPVLNNPNFNWMGGLSFEETLKLFDATTLFVNTSKSESEGFPNTFIQAWLRGVPVISFGVDPDRVITKNALGKVVRSMEEAKEAIKAYVGNENLIIIEGDIFKFAVRNYSIESVLKNFWRIISHSTGNSQWTIQKY